MSRLIVVSNRVAVPKAGQIMAGGLAVAVNSLFEDRPGMWLGWSGDIAQTSSGFRFEERGNTTFGLLDLTQQDIDQYYNGYSNRVLWPFLHYRADLAEFDRSEMEGYQRVNRHFADNISALLQPDDVLWVHDYHLIPLAKYLRARGHENRIGFFLHIPMPPVDVLGALPDHLEIIGALAQYDLVGFQTVSDRNNFAGYLEAMGALPGDDGNSFEIGGRCVQLGAFPISIETETFKRYAQQAATSRLIGEMRTSLSGQSLLIGVERLDYTKGLLERIDAFDHFLAANPEWHGRATYLQITPKSRSTVPEYRDMSDQLSRRIGEINGRFGAVTWTPLRYVNRSYTRPSLAGLYRLARVGLVTPLRDGMNLVAKEFVAAQDPADPGVLVLSRFAGASAELSVGALLVNPFDRDAMSSAITRALEMPLEERQARLAAMLPIVEANDIYHWADMFLTELSRLRSFRRQSTIDNFRRIAQRRPDPMPRNNLLSHGS
ncbi:MAG: alpha,alpha-trehalose-phosphate synthase (UDP-forming) [Alphaproteobacteria bacterium]|nr:alpha,alpha-trehalose-phosphate synthase (UDP-forming) [Alphaproteobacteria bacterium]MBU0796928.1 alpha,alpha-trehalose-phosphate synthase (UDP-forming) [Alphaproteobacteria bacterium]MBU0886908.1 alpha,alpha-trehalose-phosphate synthase (UDP-forming) [Alphaproteobacteria bacterium]MBU1812349.1 alpha,alpha-trehalose-phosphate synthase (UDP-forming) [Alphaproteobacteria bacterium]MBU2089029.1 alpha,alpha-trehalose-phosphate synthase (UDP-forming) [Alphaproteobacteria bacterium]